MKSAFPISALLRSDSYSKTYINLHPSNEPFVNWKSALSFYEKKRQLCEDGLTNIFYPGNIWQWSIQSNFLYYLFPSRVLNSNGQSAPWPYIGPSFLWGAVGFKRDRNQCLLSDYYEHLWKESQESGNSSYLLRGILTDWGTGQGGLFNIMFPCVHFQVFIMPLYYLMKEMN